MPAVASIVITVDEKGAVTALNRIDAAGKQIDPGLQKIGQRGNVVLTGIEAQSKKSAQAMQLLANITGVQMPRAMEQILSKAPGVSSALNAAFAATVVVTLAKEVLNLVDNLTGYSEQLAKIQQQSDALIQTVGAANKTLRGPQTLKQVQAEILSTAKSITELEQRIGLTGDAMGDSLTRGLAKYNQQQRVLVESLDQAKAHMNELITLDAKLTDQQKRQDVITILGLENQKRLAGLEGIKKIEQEERARVEEAQTSGRLLAENEKVTQAKVLAIIADAKAQKLAYERADNDETERLAEQALQSSLKGIDLIKQAQTDSGIELDKLHERGLISDESYQGRK